jgi:hypothetical protein
VFLAVLVTAAGALFLIREQGQEAHDDKIDRMVDDYTP